MGLLEQIVIGNVHALETVVTAKPIAQIAELILVGCDQGL